MSGPAASLELCRCRQCGARYLPRDGPCPRCASTDAVSYRVPAGGRVRAVTELMSPPSGWSAPHVLAIVEVADDVRLLATGALPAPAPGAAVDVACADGVYRMLPASPASERGEGESPESRGRGRPFEPPR